LAGVKRDFILLVGMAGFEPVPPHIKSISYVMLGQLVAYRLMILPARVQNARGKPISIHRTYLNGSGKAEIQKPKKLMPGTETLSGSAIRLFTPDGKLFEKDTLGVSEGIETAISASQLFGIATWATIAGDERPDSGCFELPLFLAGATARSQSGLEYTPLKPGYFKIMDPAFSYMVLGEYPAQGSNQLISKEWIAKARSRWDAFAAEHGEQPPEHSSGVMGLDVAELGVDSNAACFRFGGYVERIVI